MSDPLPKLPRLSWNMPPKPGAATSSQVPPMQRVEAEGTVPENATSLHLGISVRSNQATEPEYVRINLRLRAPASAKSSRRRCTSPSAVTGPLAHCRAGIHSCPSRVRWQELRLLETGPRVPARSPPGAVGPERCQTMQSICRGVRIEWSCRRQDAKSTFF